MKRWLTIIGIVIVVLLAAYGSLFLFSFDRKPVYGVSFDPDYARYLLPGNAGKAFLTVINDWNFKYVRLPVHWDVVEWTRGKFDFNDIDWYVERAGDKGVKVMLAVGHKTPRWPECHQPAWAKELTATEYRAALDAYVTAVVNHYKKYPAVEMWQVENEPFLDFGGCAAMSTQEFADEIALVKRLDPTRQIIATDSGELSLWTKTANAADLFGTTVYRKVWNPMVGVWNYRFLPAAWYRLKLWANGRSPEQAYIVELQAEPWITKNIASSTPQELLEFMSPSDVANNLMYAEQIGFPRVYLWGAEWWYWLKLHGHTTIADFIAALKKQP